MCNLEVAGRNTDSADALRIIPSAKLYVTVCPAAVCSNTVLCSVQS